LLDISIFGAPELARTVRVAGNGAIDLPFIGSILVSGFTPEDIRQVIAKKYADGNLLRDPQVSIQVKEYATQGISVMGEVAKPGIFPLLGTARLFDAIAAAGGTTPRAGAKVTILHRDRSAVPETVSLFAAAEGASESNVRVFPGDTVIVRKAGIVYVVGDVNKPGGYVMENSENFTAMQAIALAQGAARTAALNRARVIRRSAAGLQELPVPLAKIFSAKAPDMKLQAEDILFVPGSASKGAAMRSIEAILQTIPGVAIYSTVR
jgi:polysaccharide export outer membrane protein